jgi:hypothetical protein
VSKLEEVEKRAEALKQHKHPAAEDYAYLLRLVRAGELAVGALDELMRWPSPANKDSLKFAQESRAAWDSAMRGEGKDG